MRVYRGLFIALTVAAVIGMDPNINLLPFSKSSTQLTLADIRWRGLPSLSGPFLGVAVGWQKRGDRLDI